MVTVPPASLTEKPPEENSTPPAGAEVAGLGVSKNNSGNKNRQYERTDVAAFMVNDYCVKESPVSGGLQGWVFTPGSISKAIHRGYPRCLVGPVQSGAICKE